MIRDTGFLEFQSGGRTFFFVRDHSAALKCWRKAIADGTISRGSTLFHIDKHMDLCFQDKNRQKSIRILEMTEEELHDFTQEDLLVDNSEFIVNAMMAGMVKDGISVSSHEGLSFGKEANISATARKRTFSSGGMTHSLFIHETEDIGSLSVPPAIGVNHLHQDTDALLYSSESIILDIDLDFFTDSGEIPSSKRPDEIVKQITSHPFREIFRRSRIVTIALEPVSCGGMKESIRILSLLSEHWLRPIGLDVLEEVTERFLSYEDPA